MVVVITTIVWDTQYQPPSILIFHLMVVWSTCTYIYSHPHMGTQSSPERLLSQRLSVTTMFQNPVASLASIFLNSLEVMELLHIFSCLKAFLSYLGLPPVFFSTLLKFPLLDLFYTHTHTHTHKTRFSHF